MLVLTRKN